MKRKYCPPEKQEITEEEFQISEEQTQCDNTMGEGGQKSNLHADLDKK